MRATRVRATLVLVLRTALASALQLPSWLPRPIVEPPPPPPPTTGDGFREVGMLSAFAPRAAHNWTSEPTDAAAWPSVSVVLCTGDRPAFIREALRCIARQDYPAERLEVLVCDESTEAELPAPPTLTVRRLRARETGSVQRRGTKRNACLKRARGDVAVVWRDSEYYAKTRFRRQAAARVLSFGRVTPR